MRLVVPSPARVIGPFQVLVLLLAAIWAPFKTTGLLLEIAPKVCISAGALMVSVWARLPKLSVLCTPKMPSLITMLPTCAPAAGLHHDSLVPSLVRVLV